MRDVDPAGADAAVAYELADIEWQLDELFAAGKTTAAIIVKNTAYETWKSGNRSSYLQSVANKYGSLNASQKTKSSSSFVLFIVYIGSNNQGSGSTPSPTPTTQATPIPSPTITSSKVTFSDAGVSVTSASYSNESSSVNAAFDYLVSAIYTLNGLSGTNGCSIFMQSATDAVATAEKLAAYQGITAVSVTETNRGKNGSMFYFVVDSTTCFRYIYAMQSGDTSKCDSEDIQAIAALNQLLNEAKQYGSEYEKEKFFHDYLVANIEYGYPSGCSNYANQTPYGALVMKKCVCNGYASSMEILLTLSGINTIFVTGQASSNGSYENHAWLKVKIDGEWFNLDVTWDDPVPDVAGQIYYTYFNVTDEYINQNHVAVTPNLPACTSTKYMDGK